jgi:hypothetical protein
MKLRRQNSKTSRVNLRSCRLGTEPVGPESQALHEFVPRNRENSAEFGGNLDGGCVLTRLDHLNISATDIGLFSKLLLSQLSRISQAIHILTKTAIFGLAHSSSFMKNTKSAAKHTSPFLLQEPPK